jgi:LPXTG-site transpeptidase (sortase) family protein
LGERGNTLLFGHSSYLPIVGNSAYRTFNDIQKLKVDETISVYSQGREYRYRVTSVRFTKAEEATIDLRPGVPTLTLVTCDSFRTKSDRFVVEAELVGSYPNA